MERYLREWREDAASKGAFDTAIFVGDKVLDLTSEPAKNHSFIVSERMLIVKFCRQRQRRHQACPASCLCEQLLPSSHHTSATEPHFPLPRGPTSRRPLPRPTWTVRSRIRHPRREASSPSGPTTEQQPPKSPSRGFRSSKHTIVEAWQGQQHFVKARGGSHGNRS